MMVHLGTPPKNTNFTAEFSEILTLYESCARNTLKKSDINNPPLRGILY